MKLDEAAAHRVIENLADALGMTKLEAAEGVLTVINSNMANAIRSRTVQKGIDPGNSRWSRSAAPGRCMAPTSLRCSAFRK